MLVALAAPPSAAAGLDDVGILNFGLRFERLQATFYTQAEELGTIASHGRGRSSSWARTLGAHERAHVRIIKQVLGPKAGPPPSFDFGKANETDAAFTRTAVAMEDLTVALLTGIVPQVHDRALTAALLGLLTVEARHAAWARHIVGTMPAPAAFDTPQDAPPSARRARAHALHRRAAEDDREAQAEVHRLMPRRAQTRRRQAVVLALLGAAAAVGVAAAAVRSPEQPAAPAACGRAAAAGRARFHARPPAAARLDTPSLALGDRQAPGHRAGGARRRRRCGRGRARPSRQRARRALSR